MSDTSAISWTDSTFNPWIGCTKVGPGCDHCYAETLMDMRYKRVKWGTGQPRVRTSKANWQKPGQWNATDFYECRTCGWRGDANEIKRAGAPRDTCPMCQPDRGDLQTARRRVFCASLADVFDNEVDEAWRADLFALIFDTPNLDWLLLTKRIGNVPKMLEHMTEPGKPTLQLPANVWLGATVVNQEETDRDIPKLLASPARVRFLSVEPMLGPVDLCAHFGMWWNSTMGCYEGTGQKINSGRFLDGCGVGWIIVGGESGAHARPMHPDWVRSLRDQCAAAGVPFHFKQWGEWAPTGPVDASDVVIARDGRVAPFETAALKALESATGLTRMYRVGKKAAGRPLDGVEHNGFPS